MNPLLDRKFFVPDAEARVMPDGRLYIYGSLDTLGNPNYCSREYRVFSCGNENLEDWTDHGVSFSNHADNPGIPWLPDKALYAPDAVYANGKYYLYACGPRRFEITAESDTPWGPFINASPIHIADGDGIDPAVFVDDDGCAYYFWGQFHLKGARMNPDMRGIDPATLKTAILTEQEHGFHEGGSIRKRNGKYYMVYTDISRGKATCLSYAVSDSPLGPYQKRGVIIDNFYCDPSTWNNHGSIENFRGRWFVFYHRSTQNSVSSRRVCAEPIFFNADGTINEVEMTVNGASPPIDAYQGLDASLACRMKGNLYIKTVMCDGEAAETLVNCGGGNWTQDWAEYKYLNFSTGAASCRIDIRGKGKVTLMTEGWITCGVCEIGCEDFHGYTFPVSGLAGVKPIWFLFDGREIEFKRLVFTPAP